MPDVSIIIPAYNEQRRLPKTLLKLRQLIDEQKLSAEVIVVVETSQDQTLARARQAVRADRRFKVIDNKVQRGKGYAVRSGVFQAGGKYIFFMDADFSTGGSAFAEFLAYFQMHKGYAVLIGSREHTVSNIVTPQNIVRRSMGKTFNRLVQHLAIKGIKDTQCGFKAFRRQAATEIFKLQTINGFAFDVEVLMLAKKLGYKIAVLPVVWTNSEDSRVDMFSGSAAMLRDLWLIRRRLRKLPPNPNH